MERQVIFNFIESRLTYLAYRIEVRGKLNLLDLNIHSENFYSDLFNILFDWNLENLNEIQQNAPGIDLIDISNKIIVQVSATATKQKIELALSKDLSEFNDYSFAFISISKDASDLRSKSYRNPHTLAFSPQDDIYDIEKLLSVIIGLDISKLTELYEFISREIKFEPDPDRIETNIANIIKVLSNEDWSKETTNIEIIPFEIPDKIEFNKLNTSRDLIDDFKVYYHRIDKIYSEFDSQGINKSFSTLNGIRSLYFTIIKNNPEISPDFHFEKIIQGVIERVKESSNHNPIPEEELELCVQILVVDSFVRCKIFKNPSVE